MDSTTQASLRPEVGLRPYRSHLMPACDECRRGKTRCIIDVEGQKCRVCGKREIACQFTANRPPPRAGGHHSNPDARSRRRMVRRRADTGPSSPNLPGVDGNSQTETSLLVNPTMAQDVDILEQYLSGRTPASSASKPYSTLSTQTDNPIIYLKVPRYRQGLHIAVDPGRKQREILEQILGPMKLALIHV
jgi:hypothetical protein